MAMLWFCLATAMIAGYVILDGFDLGAGIVQLLVAKSEHEKAQILRSIGPVWDGNEVWLLAAGGALFLAFPALYASSFSGFYLALMMVLWLLILRGIAIEFRNHIDNPLWKPAWDTVFGLASAVLAFLFGVALGNVVRGGAAGCERVLLSPVVDELGAWCRCRGDRLVHAPGWSCGVCCTGSARRPVGGHEDRREIAGRHARV